MNMEDLKVDPIEATEVLSALRLHPAEIIDPGKQSRLLDVINYFQGHSDKSFLINRLTAGKPGLDALDHIWGYVSIRRQYDTAVKSMNTLKDELGYYER